MMSTLFKLNKKTNEGYLCLSKNIYIHALINEDAEYDEVIPAF